MWASDHLKLSQNMTFKLEEDCGKWCVKNREFA